MKMHGILIFFVSVILHQCSGSIPHPKRVVINVFDELLISAVKNCKVKETAKLLESADANIQDGLGRSPLLIAVLRLTPECENITKQLINAGADVNVGIKNKHFPLHNVVLSGHTYEIAELLIEKKADVNVIDENKYSPLAYAINLAHNKGNSSMAKLLIDSGANVNEISKASGQPLLSEAAQFGLVELVEYMITHGANVDAVDVNSNTVLHTVVGTRRLKDDNKRYAIAELLINKGANVNAKNVNDKTPIDLTSNGKIKELLTKFGATN